MKDYTFLILLYVAIVLSFSSCSDDEDKDVSYYPMEILYGTWEGTEIYRDGRWIDLSNWQYKDLVFSIKFNRNKTYSVKGFFGNGSGTYKVVRNEITIYVRGEIYLKYYFTLLSSYNEAQIVISYNDGGTIILKIKKIE